MQKKDGVREENGELANRQAALYAPTQRRLTDVRWGSGCRGNTRVGAP
jgi:hypothetical protein